MSNTPTPQQEVPIQAILATCEAEMGAMTMRIISMSAIIQAKDAMIANLQQQLAEALAHSHAHNGDVHVHTEDLVTQSHGD